METIQTTYEAFSRELTKDSPVDLVSYDPDEQKYYQISSDLYSLRLLLNKNLEKGNQPRANFDLIQTYFFVKQLSSSQVNWLILDDYFRLYPYLPKDFKFEVKPIKQDSNRKSAI